MAKINEENLAKLFRKNLFEQLKSATYKSRRKIYQYRKSDPALIKAIQEYHRAENHSLLVKKLILGGIIFVGISLAFVLLLYYPI
ncbi:MAG: hypothetical protein ACJA08_002104 [Cyclobacteriaceae bacterium]|jgi:hypothetical protein